MQKHWYIVYTKPGSEKRVATSFSKKKIENFFPVRSSKSSKSLLKWKEHSVPLFNSYIFVNVIESDLHLVKKVDGVSGLLYWRGQPAIVPGDEIGTIKEFISDYQTIRLEKTSVNPDEPVQNIDRPQYFIEGNLLSIKASSVKVKLPSLGYMMIAEIDNENRLGKEVSFVNKDMILQ